jgi:PAS domain S-box-containing protein
MKVRTILVVLSLLAILSTSLGGYLYYTSLQESAVREVERQAVDRAATIRNHLSTYLLENLKGVRVLAGLEEMRQVLQGPKQKTFLADANSMLDHFQWALRADVCYLMDRRGFTIASSNRDEPYSFVGENYAFRPYFRRAIRGETAVYMALGVTSRRRGIYYSHPVYGTGPFVGPLGVAVVKATVEPIEKEFLQVEGGIVVLADPNGVVFASNRPDWLFHLLWDLPSEERESIAASRQFGQGPLESIGLVQHEGRRAVDREGKHYLLHRLDVSEHPGWQVLYLNNLDLFLERVSQPLMRTSGSLVLVLCIIIGLAVFVLFRKASYEIVQRQRAEKALRESEETARALLNAPTDSALLLDAKGRVLAANETAIQALGTPAERILGSIIFDHFHPRIALREQRHLAAVLRSKSPARYEERRGSRVFDTSLYPVFDASGRVVRVAIFSVDITERKNVEEALRRAKEELGLYSRDLERQVRQRTREITSILENTPAVVYIKDQSYRYVMVGSRFERLFGVRSADVKGKTDYDLFPRAIAEQFRENDEKVRLKQDSVQVEERVPQEDGMHTYLSVKFPLNDEQGRMRSMCGISTDITALKKAQDRLRMLSGRIMDSQEQERAAIARELHDELGQLLTALRMDAGWLRDRLGREGGIATDRAGAMCDLIDRTLDEVRAIAIRLRPGVLDDLGLIEALEWYTEEFDQRSGFACMFRHDSLPPIRDILATAAYRIAQEALTNVARHAAATHAEVELRIENAELVLKVVDDGKGFESKRMFSENDCLGIAGMRERANLVGGILDIQSHPGNGTVVCFRVPIDGNEALGGNRP